MPTVGVQFLPGFKNGEQAMRDAPAIAKEIKECSTAVFHSEADASANDDYILDLAVQLADLVLKTDAEGVASNASQR